MTQLIMMLLNDPYLYILILIHGDACCFNFEKKKKTSVLLVQFNNLIAFTLTKKKKNYVCQLASLKKINSLDENMNMNFCFIFVSCISVGQFAVSAAHVIKN